LLLVPKSLLHGIPNTATAQDLHHAQYLQLHNIPHGPNDSPQPHPQKTSTPHIAILVPHDELVMKSYMHVWLAIVETHYHNLDDIKNQEYWPFSSNVGIKIQKALNWSTGLKTSSIFPHLGHFQFAEQYKEHHNLVYAIKFNLMATF
jgi:hypothetical protein